MKLGFVCLQKVHITDMWQHKSTGNNFNLYCLKQTPSKTTPSWLKEQAGWLQPEKLKSKTRKYFWCTKCQYWYLISDRATISSRKNINICTFSTFQANMSELGSPLKYFFSRLWWDFCCLPKQLLQKIINSILGLCVCVWWMYMCVCVCVCVCVCGVFLCVWWS